MEITHGIPARFTIHRRLGAGGFGVVYEAYDRDRDTVVALKELARSEPTALYRFKQEFRRLSDLAHPNLVTLYELIAHEDQWLLAMELIRGVNFLDHVAMVRHGDGLSSSPDWPLDGASAPTVSVSVARSSSS
ncbi:MAG TPA: protein kinase, partial [Vicinamibacterales bacterium]|nr:protein kinase [Vicinamibacterales bacterium]